MLLSRPLVHWFQLFIVVVLVGSCRKQRAVEGNFAVLHIAGAIQDGKYVVTNFNGTGAISYYLTASRIGTHQSPFPGKYYIGNPQLPLAFYAFPDTLPGNKPVLNLNMQLQMGEAYTLFLAGSTSSLDTVLIKETIPAISPSDSISAVRFVNLGNTGAISVNLKGKPNGSAVQRLPYKGITTFAHYPVTHNIASYEFEIRDAATGNLITTFVDDEVYPGAGNGIHLWLGKVRTHVFMGTPGITTGVNRAFVRYFIQN
jgi:hypothetical protein